MTRIWRKKKISPNSCPPWRSFSFLMVVTQVCLDAAQAAQSPKSPQSALPEWPFRSTVPTGLFAGISPQPAIGVIDLEGQCAFLSIVALSRVRFSVRQHIWEKVMKYFAIFSLAALLMASEPARAGQILGPFSDGDLSIESGPQSVQRMYPTKWTGTTSTGQTVGGRDILIINSSSASLVLWEARSTIFVTLPDSGELTGQAILTTVYGQKQSDGSVTGFTDPSVFQPVGGETHIGKSGKEYHSYFSQQIAGTALSTTLAGYDLSPFDLGTTSPYQVFETEIPAFEISAVPEPSALALLLVGISGLACVRLKAKRPKSL